MSALQSITEIIETVMSGWSAKTTQVDPWTSKEKKKAVTHSLSFMESPHPFNIEDINFLYKQYKNTAGGGVGLYVSTAFKFKLCEGCS